MRFACVRYRNILIYCEYNEFMAKQAKSLLMPWDKLSTINYI